MALHRYINTGEDISGSGTIIEFDVDSYGFLEVQLANAGGSADYEVQVGDGSTWFTGQSYSSVTSIDDTLEMVAPKVRLEITSGAGGSNTADVLVLFDDRHDED